MFIYIYIYIGGITLKSPHSGGVLPTLNKSSLDHERVFYSREPSEFFREREKDIDTSREIERCVAIHSLYLSLSVPLFLYKYMRVYIHIHTYIYKHTYIHI